MTISLLGEIAVVLNGGLDDRGVETLKSLEELTDEFDVEP